MRLSLHRTIPFIAFAALVTVSPAGAQQRDDSTSTAGVVSLLGLGAKFVVLSVGNEDASRPNDWNCAGGCRAFGARSLGIAPFGAALSAPRSSSRASSVAAERSARSLADRADLSDYGWSRRVNTDGSPLAPVSAVPVNAVPVFESTENAPAPSADMLRPSASLSSPDGAGQAPAWAALGSGPSDLDIPRSEWPSWTNEAGDEAGESGNQGTDAVSPAPAVTRLAESIDQVAPLVTTVPEPSTVVLLAAGLSSLLIMRRRSTRSR